MPVNYRDWSINREAVKALVALYGPSETSRQTGIPKGTVLTWCRRYKWKKAEKVIRTGANIAASQDAADAIASVMAKHREETTTNLAEFTAKASRQATKLKDPLSKARAVRDVASVYSTLWPPEDGGEMIEGAILVGNAIVQDDAREILAAAEVEDVRETISDQRPEGH